MYNKYRITIKRMGKNSAGEQITVKSLTKTVNYSGSQDVLIHVTGDAMKTARILAQKSHKGMYLNPYLIPHHVEVKAVIQ